MTKKKISLEYMLTAKSGSIIWNMISTPAGLERWFADEAELHDGVYTFHWGKEETRSAKVTAQRTGMYIRMHWTDETESNTFFEIRMSRNELTGDFTLSVIDFADDDEVEDLKEIWNHQINTLCQTGGA